ncbi:hypothetical protein M011DRAFT_529929 [Sporormia fimetaria CBS 119925]|uniref:Uncharacterized protein n=1 Tax=Sporormia fimetaria CBS 119925 TaxID=1340428 RepID=A0A6A6UWZ2_9PLEO|nr:hypothetical protein M011DRAFT_529929 [Sporormia fimetaria CBS 119925]
MPHPILLTRANAPQPTGTGASDIRIGNIPLPALIILGFFGPFALSFIVFLCWVYCVKHPRNKKQLADEARVEAAKRRVEQEVEMQVQGLMKQSKPALPKFQWESRREGEAVSQPSASRQEAMRGPTVQFARPQASLERNFSRPSPTYNRWRSAESRASDELPELLEQTDTMVTRPMPSSKKLRKR